MKGSSITLNEGDRVLVKPVYKYPVPTAHEVKLLLDYLPDFSAAKVGIALLVIQAMRPVEVPRLIWPKLFWCDDKCKILKMRHLVYKPSNRATQTGTNYYFKEVEKPLLSNWLSDQIKGYASVAPKYPGSRLFPFKKHDSLQKVFTKLRKDAKEGKLGPEYECFLDQAHETVVGQNLTKYRINLYSLRRFAVTWIYYMVCDQDPVRTAAFIGHTRPDTTMTHYVQPKEAIGLTQEMIDKKVPLDKFIHLKGKKQMVLPEFYSKPKPFVPAGQRTLWDYRERC